MPKDRIMSGRITFSTDAVFIQLTDNGQFIDLSGDAVLQPNFEENTFNHQRVSVFGHMGDRSLGEDPNSFPKVHSFIAAKVVLQTHIELRAFNISQSAHSGSALDNWLRAEKELLVGAEGARLRYGLILWPQCGMIASNGICYGSGKIGGDPAGFGSHAVPQVPRLVAAAGAVPELPRTEE
jgi:hypothetical protein